MLDKLKGMGARVTWEEIEELAQGETIGRPHIARALVNRGYVASTQDAFAQYIGRQGPAYVSRFRPDPAMVIERIRAAGGVAVLAHPAQSGVTSRISEFVRMGLQGLEIYYPGHSPSEVKELEQISNRLSLLRTGGSDFHGPGHREGANLGEVYVPLECATELRLAATNNRSV
jgi:predicted metal-dependent phosphoesterase TrpH